MLKLYAYNAGKGECIRLSFGDGHNVFIDTGVTRFSAELQRILFSITADGETLDALILTHVDDDHIGGVLSLLRHGVKLPFREVWMNVDGHGIIGDVPLSVRHNNEVYARLVTYNIKPVMAGTVYEIAGAMFRVIAPRKLYKMQKRGDIPLSHHSDYSMSIRELQTRPLTKHDNSINNRNSAVIIFEYEGHRLLFTGDAWAEDIFAGLGEKPQYFDLVKMPHHGAVGNISDEWPGHIKTEKVLICTDGIAHPDKHTIAKLVQWYEPLTIYSPAIWWQGCFRCEEDKKINIDFQMREGLVYKW
jgi:beta-lactamase superfamily II metal-dependent hydrolase